MQSSAIGSIIEYGIGNLLGLLPWWIALIVFFGVAYYIASEMQNVCDERNLLKKISRIAIILIVAGVAHYFFQIYIDSLKGAPPGTFSIALYVLIALASFIMWLFHIRPKSRTYF